MNAAPRTPFLIAWMIWATFLAGLVGLLLLVEIQQETLGAALEPGFSILWLRTLGYFVAIVLFPIIGGIKKHAKGEPTTVSDLIVRSPQAHPSTDRYISGLILAFALAEGIGILGFILFLFGDTPQTLYIFIGLSALAMILHRPRAEDFA